MRRTKIVATVGPATASPDRLQELISAGLDVVRLNFSHGTHAEHGRVLATVRELAEAADRPVAVLQDLAGPKIRTGPMAAGPVRLRAGQDFTLTSRDVPGDVKETGLTFAELPAHVKTGDMLLLADGTLELKVRSSDGENILCEVIVGGDLDSHKGINAAAGSLPVPILTDKDRSDLAFGLAQDVDYVAVSFVRTAADVRQVRDLVRAAGRRVPLIAKIEQREAIDNLSEILDEVDGVMIARGDLGVEIPLEMVPQMQKRILAAANRAGLPTITATQMLRTMVENPNPTRAEVSDVANAVLDGTDAVMLSEETAIGEYPIRAVETMDRTTRAAEDIFPFERPPSLQKETSVTPEEGVARAACGLAREVDAAAIVVLTQSGSTARQVARWRPRRPVLALTPEPSTHQRLALVWGVVPRLMKPASHLDELEIEARRIVLESGLVGKGGRVVITAGLPLHEPGTTNLVRVMQV